MILRWLTSVLLRIWWVMLWWILLGRMKMLWWIFLWWDRIEISLRTMLRRLGLWWLNYCHFLVFADALQHLNFTLPVKNFGNDFKAGHRDSRNYLLSSSTSILFATARFSRLSRESKIFSSMGCIRFFPISRRTLEVDGLNSSSVFASSTSLSSIDLIVLLGVTQSVRNRSCYQYMYGTLLWATLPDLPFASWTSLEYLSLMFFHFLLVNPTISGAFELFLWFWNCLLKKDLIIDYQSAMIYRMFLWNFK